MNSSSDGPLRRRIGELFQGSLEVPWRATRAPGVRWCPLYLSGDNDEDTSGDATVLIAMAPGCSYPPHRHVGVEEVWVLQGGYRDEWGDHVAGDWLRYPAGSVHAPTALGSSSEEVGPENPECLLYAVARNGIVDLRD